jgi:DNA polymerase-3 subunit alpha
VRSEYFIVDGLVRIDDLVRTVAKDKQAALAVTNQASLFGMVKFYKSARGKGIKPIFGCDVGLPMNALDQAQECRLANCMLLYFFRGYLKTRTFVCLPTNS